MKLKIFVSAFACILIVSVLISAGISSPYWSTNPLEMYPGQIREVSFNLQNCPSMSSDCQKKDIKVVASVVEGGEIAQLVGNGQYTVPYGSSNINAAIKVSIPENNFKDVYQIRVVFKEVLSESSGGVQLGLEYDSDFPVIIKDKSEINIPPTPLSGDYSKIVIGLIIVIIVLILLILIILYKLSKKNKFK